MDKTILEEVGIEINKSLENKANKDLSNVSSLPSNIVQILKGEKGSKGDKGDRGANGNAGARGPAGTNANLKITYGESAIKSRWSPGGGRFSWSYNYVLVYPPSGYNMSHLKGFICSNAIIHYAGGVDGNDSLYCRWRKESSYIRAVAYNTENRSTSYLNYMAIWEK